jgi:hypothetical protein
MIMFRTVVTEPSGSIIHIFEDRKERTMKAHQMAWLRDFKSTFKWVDSVRVQVEIFDIAGKSVVKKLWTVPDECRV